MKNNLPERKRNRLKEYDYSSCGVYFITICARKRDNYFWSNAAFDSLKIVGAISDRPPIVYNPQDVVLSECGMVVDEAINKITSIYPAVSLEHYVIMPDHIHLLLMVCSEEDGRSVIAPTMSQVVKHLKGTVTKQLGESVWQKSFYDHVIRNKTDYDKHVKYIYENPMNWQFDYNKTGDQ